MLNDNFKKFILLHRCTSGKAIIINTDMLVSIEESSDTVVRLDVTKTNDNNRYYYVREKAKEIYGMICDNDKEQEEH